MLLIFQSIFVSVTGFWRFLILLPFLLVVNFFLWAIAFILVPDYSGLFAASLGVFAFLIAVRTTLTKIGEDTTLVLVRLLSASVIFIILELILFAPMFWASYFAILPTEVTDPSAPRPKLVGMDGLIHAFNVIFQLLGFLFVIIILFGVLQVAFMVPMAAASWSASKGMPKLGLFWGFGASFAPLSVICLTTVAIRLALEIPLNTQTLSLITLDQILRWSDGRPLRPVDPRVIITLVLKCGVNIALTYWQASAAALAFIRVRDRHFGIAREAPKGLQPSRIDARGLRKSREGQGP
ncbi:MAG: hypothetical protein ABI459_08925 [Deltaproteobacteria bacterium]